MNSPAATQAQPLANLQRLARHAARMRRAGLIVTEPNDHTIVVALPASQSGMLLMMTMALEGYDVCLSQKAPDGTATLTISDHGSAAALRGMN